SDPNYRALRDSAIAESWHVENLALTRDAGVITLREGTVGFLPPALNRVTTGVFTGSGRFQLKPAIGIEHDHLKRATGEDAVDEEFTSAVFLFTDGTAEEI